MVFQESLLLPFIFRSPSDDSFHSIFVIVCFASLYALRPCSESHSTLQRGNPSFFVVSDQGVTVGSKTITSKGRNTTTDELNPSREGTKSFDSHVCFVRTHDDTYTGFLVTLFIILGLIYKKPSTTVYLCFSQG